MLTICGTSLLKKGPSLRRCTDSCSVPASAITHSIPADARATTEQSALLLAVETHHEHYSCQRHTEQELTSPNQVFKANVDAATQQASHS